MSFIYSTPLINRWRLYIEGPKRDFSTRNQLKAPSEYISSEKLWRTPKYVLDIDAGKFYWNEYKSTIRLKSFLLALPGFLNNITCTIAAISIQILKIISLYSLIDSFLISRTFEIINPLIDLANDCVRLIALPIYLIGIELSAIYGILMPYDGRKLYTFFEKAIYGKAIIPCFMAYDEPTGESKDLDQN